MFKFKWEKSSSSSTLKPAIYSQPKESWSDDEENQKFIKMTNHFDKLIIKIPMNKKILLRTQVESDGIGDFMHQIRAFNILNQTFKDNLVCHTICNPRMEMRLRDIANELKFETQFNKEIITDNLALIVDISYPCSSDADTDNIRNYQLLEIANPSFSLDPKKRIQIDHMGFLPGCQGIWIDEIPLSHEKENILESGSSALKRILSCENISNSAQAKEWLNHTWIAQSQVYSCKIFILTLAAQLSYIQKRSLVINQFFTKYMGIDRDNHEWKMSEKLMDPEYINIFSRLNVKCIILDGVNYLVDESKSVVVHISKNRLSSNDYFRFQQLMNGMIFPAGDITYSEAYSNPNTLLPPLPELREYKNETLNPLFTIIKSLSLPTRDIDWLISFYMGYKVLTQRYDANPAAMLDRAERLVECWASNDKPQIAWHALHDALKKQDLAKRLPSIVKEQLLFASFPKLEKKKISLIKNQEKNAISQYEAEITKSLEQGQSIPRITGEKRSWQ
jgi:hypothetical protein